MADQYLLTGILDSQPLSPSPDTPTFTPYFQHGGQLITSPPAADSPLAYNEDDIVSALSQIYEVFLDLGYLQPEKLILPPDDTGRHVVDHQRLQDELNLSPRVISLVERLPYVVDVERDEFQFYVEAMPINYLDEKHRSESRIPGNIPYFANSAGEPIDSFALLPQDIALSYPYNGDGFTLILDTEMNTIRFLYDIWEIFAPDGYQLEYPDKPDHYRNHPGFHATAVLKHYHEELLSLKYYPKAGLGIGSTDHFFDHAVAAQILSGQYGWPQNFRADAWRSVRRRVELEAEEEDDVYQKKPKPNKWVTTVDKDEVAKSVANVIAKLGI